MVDNTGMNLIETEHYDLDWDIFVSGKDLEESFREHGNKPSLSVKGGQLNDTLSEC